MRLLEITLALVLAVHIFWQPWWAAFLPAIVALPHLLIEGYRWQMIPLYGITLIVTLFSIGGFVRSGRGTASRPARPDRGRKGWVAASIGGVFLVAGVALPSLFPIPKIPAPTGPHPVGTVTLYLVDSSRTDPYADDPSALRELMVQIWYPANPSRGAEIAPWMENLEIVGPAVSDWIDMPSFFLDHAKYARTHAYQDVPLSGALDKYPVVHFSHGYGGFRAQNTFQMEELASHGYVVVATEHTYASVATVFPDGRVAPHNPNTLPDNNRTEEEYDRGANQLLRQWAADIRFVFDTLETLNQGDPDGRFTGRLDLDRIGVFGHSTGGGAAVELCATDSRCKAGLGMDAWMIPVSKAIIARGPEQPFMFMFSEAWRRPRNIRLFSEMFAGMSNPVFNLTLAGTAHYDFSDLPALSPLAPYLDLKGPLRGARVQQIINDYTLAFFGKYLKGEDSVLLDGPSEAYPEVTFN